MKYKIDYVYLIRTDERDWDVGNICILNHNVT